MDSFETIAEYWVESSRRTRLGGEICCIVANDARRYFVKNGSGFERRELLRESRMLTCLRGLGIAPEVREFHDHGDRAVLVTEAVPGTPLHEAAAGDAEMLRHVLIEVIERFLALDPAIYKALPVAVHEEIADIEELIDSPQFDAARFRSSVGSEPKPALERIKRAVNLYAHEGISHGDLCLPNVQVSSIGTWRVLDWGKSGRGNLARDIAALRPSLERNQMGRVWQSLSEFLVGRVSEHELVTYRELDYFWYAMK